MIQNSAPSPEALAGVPITTSPMPGAVAVMLIPGLNRATPHHFEAAIVARTDGFHRAGGVRRAPGQPEEVTLC